MDKGLSETRTIPQTLRYECLGLPYSFFRVALMGFLGLPYGKVRIYIEYIRIKLEFIRII